MVEKTVKIIRNGGITLPKDIREKYDLKEGDQLIFIEDADGFKLIPAKINPRKS